MKYTKLRPQILLAMLILATISTIALVLDVPAGKEVSLVSVAGIIATMHKLIEPSD